MKDAAAMDKLFRVSDNMQKDLFFVDTHASSIRFCYRCGFLKGYAYV